MSFYSPMTAAGVSPQSLQATTNPQAAYGAQGAPMGQGQGYNGIPMGYLGSLFGGMNNLNGGNKAGLFGGNPPRAGQGGGAGGGIWGGNPPQAGLGGLLGGLLGSGFGGNPPHTSPVFGGQGGFGGNPPRAGGYGAAPGLGTKIGGEKQAPVPGYGPHEQRQLSPGHWVPGDGAGTRPPHSGGGYGAAPTPPSAGGYGAAPGLGGLAGLLGGNLAGNMGGGPPMVGGQGWQGTPIQANNYNGPISSLGGKSGLGGQLGQGGPAGLQGIIQRLMSGQGGPINGPLNR